MKKVAVYCASSSRLQPIYVHSARQLGTALAQRQWTCINGGGNQGLMAEVSNASLAQGGQVIGVIPQFMVDEGWVHSSLSELIITESMHVRKETMAQQSDGCITLPGGIGTFEELLEIITWKQLGLYAKPVVILNINNYYQPLLQLFEQAVAQNFMHLRHQHIYQVTESVEEALAIIEAGCTWIENPRSIAAL